jgi:hypothetical protein
MTISELRLALDLSFDDKAKVLRQHAKWMSNSNYLFVDSSNGECYLFDEDGNEDDICKLTYIEDRLFHKDDKLKLIVIPDSVRSIDKFAFSNCGRLTYAAICEGVTSIKWSTFSGCSSLVSVMIPDSVTSIDGYAFHCCSSLTGVTIGSNVTSIKAGAFYGCSGLTSVTIPNNTMSIEYSAFESCHGLISVKYHFDRILLKLI